MRKTFTWFACFFLTSGCSLFFNDTTNPSAQAYGEIDIRKYASIPSFPGAEGFGSYASGGRDGKVIYVTNLNATGPGSLYEALGSKNKDYSKSVEALGKRYVLFKVSGLVATTDAWDDHLLIREGNLSVAGQTSPGGIIVKGLYSGDDEGRDKRSRDNVIIRHIKSRLPIDQDCLRLEQIRHAIVDHCSFAWADDECVQISYANSFTIQNCILAETLGEHYDKGGVLIKFSSLKYPLDNISFHHNMIHRIGGRVPQLDKYIYVTDVETDDSYVTEVEISQNLIWDPVTLLLISECFITPYGKFFTEPFHANYMDNYLVVRDAFDKAMLSNSINPQNKIYLEGNRMNKYPQYCDIQLMDGCNEFYKRAPNTKAWAGVTTAKNAFPATSRLAAGDETRTYMVKNAGAFPRDAMDRRYMQSVLANTIDTTHQKEKGADDGFVLDFAEMPLPPLDSDDDGMPDDWEIFNGLDPLSQDHNGKSLSRRYTGIDGYDNLEAYLHSLSEHLIKATALTTGSPASYPLSINPTLSSGSVKRGSSLTINVDGVGIAKAEVSLNHVENPFALAHSKTQAMSQANGKYTLTYTIPSSARSGNYTLLVHGETSDGKDGYKTLSLRIE